MDDAIGLIALISGFLTVPAVIGWVVYEQAGIKAAAWAVIAVFALAGIGLAMIDPGSSGSGRYHEREYDPNGEGPAGSPSYP